MTYSRRFSVAKQLRAAFLSVLLTSSPVSAGEPVSLGKLRDLVENDVHESLILRLVERDCVEFEITADNLAELSGILPTSVIDAALKCLEEARRGNTEAGQVSSAEPNSVATASIGDGELSSPEPGESSTRPPQVQDVGVHQGATNQGEDVANARTLLNLDAEDDAEEVRRIWEECEQYGNLAAAEARLNSWDTTRPLLGLYKALYQLVAVCGAARDDTRVPTLVESVLVGGLAEAKSGNWMAASALLFLGVDCGGYQPRRLDDAAWSFSRSWCWKRTLGDLQLSIPRAELLSVVRNACQLEGGYACGLLAGHLAHGTAITADPKSAFELLEQQCNQVSYPLACEDLAEFYYYGTGILTDNHKAFEILQNSCINGSLVGCFRLGFLLTEFYRLAHYSSVRQDNSGRLPLSANVEAVSITSIRSILGTTCQKGFLPACEKAAEAFTDSYWGSTLRFNPTQIVNDEAVAQLLMIGCKGHSSTSCSYLGDLFRSGHGVAKNPEAAVVLYGLACKSDSVFHREACKRREKLCKKGAFEGCKK